MPKRKVLIAVHQLNLGGAQKALISALDAIDYSKNDVTVYIRKDRINLINDINKHVAGIIINKDNTKYYRKPYTAWLELLIRFKEFFHANTEQLFQKQVEYITKCQYRYEYKHYFLDNDRFDIAVSYIQGDTAGFLDKYIYADKKIMFFHGSKDDHHQLHNEIMKRYDKIYCVSKGAQKAVQGFYPQFANKIDCLENYVDADRVRAEAGRFIPDYPKDKLILCSCGRITSVKGFDLAVGAAEILRNKELDFKWYFVGDGIDRPKIEALIAEKELQNYIEITGLQDNPYPYIKHCDIYIQPSYEESQGLTMIEAKILCKPIVSTKTVGGMSVVFDGVDGLLVDINPESIAEGILLLSGDKDTQKRFQETLSKKDYQSDYTRFCRQWAELLGD